MWNENSLGSFLWGFYMPFFFPLSSWKWRLFRRWALSSDNTAPVLNSLSLWHTFIVITSLREMGKSFLVPAQLRKVQRCTCQGASNQLLAKWDINTVSDHLAGAGDKTPGLLSVLVHQPDATVTPTILGRVSMQCSGLVLFLKWGWSIIFIFKGGSVPEARL